MNRPAFDPKELEPLGFEPGFMGRGPGRPIFNTPITPKENYLMSMRHEKPLWMPMGDGSSMITPAVPDNIARAFVFETEKIPMDSDHVGGLDMFGVDWEYVPTAGGSMVRGGSPKVPDVTEWEKYVTFPDLDDIIDWKTISERNKNYGDPRKALSVTILNGLFERLISFMDMQGAMIALVDEEEQEGVHRLFDKLCDFYDDYIRHYVEYFHVDQVQFHDDWGSQRAPFFSADTVREMLLPYLSRIAASAHKYGCFFELHSCGKNQSLVTLMAEAGVDSWQPQPMNDFEQIYHDVEGRMSIVIPLDRYISADMDESEKKERLAAFVEQHPYAQASTWTAPEGSAELLYAISRKAFCG